jgi:hypothetical protein
MASVVSTLADIEAAIPHLSAGELVKLARMVHEQLEKQSGQSATIPKNLWGGARERLRALWGERVLSDGEVAEMRDYEDGE